MFIIRRILANRHWEGPRKLPSGIGSGYKGCFRVRKELWPRKCSSSSQGPMSLVAFYKLGRWKRIWTALWPVVVTSKLSKTFWVVIETRFFSLQTLACLGWGSITPDPRSLPQGPINRLLSPAAHLLWPISGQYHPTPVLLPGKSHGRGSLVGCSQWGHRSRTRLKRLSSSNSSSGQYNRGQDGFSLTSQSWLPTALPAPRIQVPNLKEYFKLLLKCCCQLHFNSRCSY